MSAGAATAARPVERVVLVTQATSLEGLVRRYQTKGQAKFVLSKAGDDFSRYQTADDAYARARETLHRALDLGLPFQEVRKEHLPTFLFREGDLVVTLGRDGLVANTAKYVGGRPILAVNPDPARIDGVLLPFLPTKVRAAAAAACEGQVRVREVTMAEVRLADGQRLLAFNDLFLGARSHVSARYRIGYKGVFEDQSSSGLIVSTGAGSTGWLSSVFQMASAVTRLAGGEPGAGFTLPWDAPGLVFVVREPFVSKTSSARLACGRVEPPRELSVESRMPEGGVIFSDGIQEDYLSFCAGAVATIGPAAQRARLLVG